MSLFFCPICAAPLAREGNIYRCPGGHSYDVARSGYVHLLPANKKHSADPGDDREMTAARTRFLDGGWYSPLRQALCDLALTHAGPSYTILDAGCGEGYYTAGLHEALPQAQVCGFDISKLAVKAAAGKYKSVEFGVASSFAIPLGKASVHLLTDVFSPLAEEEFARVVKPGGFFLYAVPGERHLYGLKELLYENPYENPHRETEYPGFRFVGRTAVRGEIRVPDSQTAVDLFTMTPYYWKTGPQAAQRLETVEGFSTEIGFDFLLYQRQ